MMLKLMIIIAKAISGAGGSGSWMGRGVTRDKRGVSGRGMFR